MTSSATAPGGGIGAHARPPPAPVVPAVPVVPPRPALPVVPPVPGPEPPVLPALPVVPPIPAEPVVPALPVVLPPVPVDPPVPVVLHTPPEHVPLHGRLQPPQLSLLVVVSMHEEPQSISDPLQTQLLFEHVAPAGQAWPHEPQFALSVVRLAHLPPEHCVSVVMQPDAQLPPLHTCVPVQVLPHVPQLLTSDGTQALLQLSCPAPQTQAPA